MFELTHCTIALFCITLHYRALPLNPLYCTTLYYTALYCTDLDFTALHCTALHCTTLHYTALHYNAVLCTALFCTALHYIVAKLPSCPVTKMQSSQVPSINQSSIINQSLIILGATDRPTVGPMDTNYVPNNRQQTTDRQTGTPVEACPLGMA